MPERVLVSHFYAHNVGHAIEAIHYGHGHWRADPSRSLSLLLNAAAPTELGEWAPWIDAVHPVAHPLTERCADSLARLATVPRDWDLVVEDFRRHQDWQHQLFGGLTDFYAATDEWLRAPRADEGDARAGYDPAPWRLSLPEAARRGAAARLDDGAPARIALMPGGSSPAQAYPSTAAWLEVLDALADALGAQVVLVGRRPGGERTATTLGAGAHAALAGHLPGTVDAFDLPLRDQLALVEACDVFVSPHTGFGLAALAVGTPWLTVSGGRWFEYFFNGVPFRSILPGPEHRSPAQGTLDPAVLLDVPAERDPSMTDARIATDLPRIVAAAEELVAGTLPYERALTEYFSELVTVVDPHAIWSIDGVHAAYV